MIPPERDTLPPAAESHIPGPARLPTGLRPTEHIDPIVSLAERVGNLSDALHSPDGPVHLLIAALGEKSAKRELRAQKRHRQLMRMLRHVIDNQVAGLARLNRLEPQVEEHAARLKLVIQTGGAAE